MNKNFDLVLLLFGTFSLFTEHGNTRAYSFSHTLPSVTTRGDAHTLCVLSHTDTWRSDCCPLSDPRIQRSWQTAILAGSQRSSRAAILVCSAVIALSWRPLVNFALSRRPLVNFTLKRLSFGIVCTSADLVLSRRSSLLSNPLVYLVVLWVKIFVG